MLKINLKQLMIVLVGPIRSRIMRLIRPKNKYFLFGTSKKRLKPISKVYGFDRGKPIDRYYIEKFLENNKKYIKGKCLEITDNVYTKKYGGRKVKESDVLDIDEKNGRANITGNLKKLGGIKSDTYDCVILTHVLGMIDDYEKAIVECRRVLKSTGALLITWSSVASPLVSGGCYWKLTPNSAKYIFGKYFSKSKLKIGSGGNVLSGQAFWVGLSTEELSEKELSHNDPRYPIIITIRAVK